MTGTSPRSRPGPPGPARYGGGAPAWVRVGGLVLLAAAFVAWVVWAALGVADAPVRAGLLTFEVVDDTTAAARIQVARDPGRRVECVVRAVGPDRSVVGTAAVAVPTEPPSTRVLAVEVPTRSRAVAVLLGGCRSDAE